MKVFQVKAVALLSSLLSSTALAQSGDLALVLDATPDLSSSSPRDAAVGDFDGDGRLDVVVACSGTDSGFGVVNVLLNDGYPKFDDKSTSTGGAPWAVCAADFDGDGLDDFAVADGGSSSNVVRIFRSVGQGAFTSGATLSTGGFPVALESTDFNGDGHADLAVACNSSGGLMCFLGSGDGTFGAPIALGGTHATDVAIGDVNGDGHADVAYAHYDGAKVFLGHGDGTFASDYLLGTGQLTEALALGDLNGDGKDDLVAVELYSSVLRVALSHASGLGPSSSIPLSGDLRDVCILDINGDGLRDVVLANESSDKLSVLLGLGGGALGPRIDHATPFQPRAIAAADLNGDGRADLAAACRNGGETPPLACFTNQSPVPEWTLVGPALPGAGGAASWTGSGALQAGAPVTFNLAGGPTHAQALAFVGLTAANLPLLGGTLVPAIDTQVTGLVLSPAGALTFPWTWPAELSTSGAELYTQVWFLDASAPQLVGASNGLRARVP